MMVTDKFVMLNLPKTGSTFARAVLKELYAKRYRQLPMKKKIAIRLKLSSPLLQEMQVPNSKFKQGLKARRDPHGGYYEIPEEHKSKEVFSIVRDPYQRLLSGYTYRHWVKWPPVPSDVLSSHFPEFPNLSIDSYVRMLKLSASYRSGFESVDVCIGSFSIQFIQMFFKNPSEVLKNINDKYIDSGKAIEDMADVTFLRQEHLREDLKSYLLRFEFSETELSIIDTINDKNVSGSNNPERNKLLTSTVIEYINNEERLMFNLLKQHGVDYNIIDPC